MNKTIIAIILLTIGALITELINIFFSPFKKWALNKTNDSCKFIFPNEPLTGTYHNIEITKRFGKTIHINYPWFRIREMKELKNKAYLHCPFGGENGRGDKCPFC